MGDIEELKDNIDIFGSQLLFTIFKIFYHLKISGGGTTHGARMWTLPGALLST